MNPYYYNTYTTKRFPLVGNPDYRVPNNISKDQSFVNVFASESKSADGSKYYLEQRGGLAININSGVTGTGRGVYYWNGSIFYVIGNTLYKDSSALQVLSTSTGTVGFQEFANNTNQNFLIVLDGTSGWVINSSFTVTKITDADFPSPHCTKSAYIDGYLVVAKAGTADLYNSNLNDPLTWTTGDFITAEAMPDTVVALCRQNNYVVALGTQTVEYFYDNGTYPGTPFARNDAAMHQIGSPAPDTLVLVEGMTIFVGQTQTGGLTVWSSDGSSPNEIGIESVRQSLANEGANISSAAAFAIRSKGHKFYVLCLASKTWVYDFDTGMWDLWVGYGVSKFSCNYASDYKNGYPLLLDNSSGYVYTMNDTLSTDEISPGTTRPISCAITTQKYDFGNMNRKFMSRFTLVCDITTGTNATLYWTDDDYQTFSNYRLLDTSSTMPSTTQLGAFRRRAFQILYSSTIPVRLEGFEVDINLGSQ